VSTVDETAMRSQTTAIHPDEFPEYNIRQMTEMETVSREPAEMRLDRHRHQLQQPWPPPPPRTGKTGRLMAMPSYSTPKYRLHSHNLRIY